VLAIPPSGLAISFSGLATEHKGLFIRLSASFNI
jgi:hypothetical protein